MHDALGEAGGMGPAEGDAEEGVCVLLGANAHAADVGGWQVDAPEAIGEVNGGDAGGL